MTNLSKCRPENPEYISFEHKFFSSIDGIYFFKDELRGDLLIHLPLDGKEAHLPINGLKNELKLKEGCPDDLMLETVAASLEFVPRIRVGDKVPMELRTGQASWEVNEQHRKIASSRLSMQLVTWMSGDEEIVHDASQLEMIADDPAMRTKINDAFSEAAEKLGMRRDDKEEVIALINGLAGELAYVESLRGTFEEVTIVEQRIDELLQVYSTDRVISEPLLQAHRLCKIPMTAFRNKFEEIDAQTGEIIAVLKNMAAQIKFIREARDDLFRRLWAWQGLAQKWRETEARCSMACEALIQEIYRFLAQRFLPQKEWELFTKAQENAAKSNTESVWA